MVIHGADSDEDNFDIVMDTAEKVCILRPVLRAELLDPMIEEIRLKSVDVLDETLNTFYPEPDRSSNNDGEATQAINVKVKQIPTWLKKWAPQKPRQEPEVVEPINNTADQDTATPMEREGEEVPKIKVKRRLQRRCSDFDKITNAPIQRNEERSRLIEKARSIFNTIVDSKDDGVTIAGIITHLIKFEECWTRFPKTTAEVNLESADKLKYATPIQNYIYSVVSP